LQKKKNFFCKVLIKSFRDFLFFFIKKTLKRPFFDVEFKKVNFKSNKVGERKPKILEKNDIFKN